MQLAATLSRLMWEVVAADLLSLRLVTVLESSVQTKVVAEPDICLALCLEAAPKGIVLCRRWPGCLGSSCPIGLSVAGAVLKGAVRWQCCMCRRQCECWRDLIGRIRALALRICSNVHVRSRKVRLIRPQPETTNPAFSAAFFLLFHLPYLPSSFSSSSILILIACALLHLQSSRG